MFKNYVYLNYVLTGFCQNPIRGQSLTSVIRIENVLLPKGSDPKHVTIPTKLVVLVGSFRFPGVLVG